MLWRSEQQSHRTSYRIHHIISNCDEHNHRQGHTAYCYNFDDVLFLFPLSFLFVRIAYLHTSCVRGWAVYMESSGQSQPTMRTHRNTDKYDRVADSFVSVVFVFIQAPLVPRAIDPSPPPHIHTHILVLHQPQ